MGSIVLKRSSIIIEDYNQAMPNSEFENLFRYIDLFYKKATEKIRYIYKCLEFENGNAIIPRGFVNTTADAQLKLFMLPQSENVIDDPSYDEYDTLTGVNVKSLPRDNIQKEALRFMIGTDEYADNADRSQYSINLNTGAGKTYVTIMTSIALGLKPIIIASTFGWVQQWKEKYLEYTDISEDEIYIIQGASSILRIIKGLEDVSRYKVFLATHSTIHTYGKNSGWDKVDQLFKTIRVGMKVFDEAHMNFDNICSIDFHTNTYKTYYLTATPARSNSDENSLYQKIYFKNVAKIDLFNADRDNRTNYVAYLYKSNMPNDLRQRCYTYYYGFNRVAYMNYLVTTENFHRILHIAMKYIAKIQGKVLIYIGTNEAIFRTREWIYNNYPEYSTEIGVYTSMTDKEDKKKELEKRIIFSTTKSAGAASDIAGLKLVIVLDEPFKSEVLARQTLGRARDYNTLYFEFVDTSFYEIKNFYKYKLKRVFSKYALSCHEVDLTTNLESQVNELLGITKIKKPKAKVNYSPYLKPISLRPNENNIFNSLMPLKQLYTIDYDRLKKLRGDNYGISC